MHKNVICKMGICKPFLWLEMVTFIYACLITIDENYKPLISFHCSKLTQHTQTLFSRLPVASSYFIYSQYYQNMVNQLILGTTTAANFTHCAHSMVKSRSVYIHIPYNHYWHLFALYVHINLWHLLDGTWFYLCSSRQTHFSIL